MVHGSEVGVQGAVSRQATLSHSMYELIYSMDGLIGCAD